MRDESRTRKRGVTVAPRNFPTNKGGLCQKGWTAAELLSSTDRLTSPLLRDSRAGEIRPVSWDEALDRATGRGEVVVKGPTVMAGYFREPEGTRAVLRNGWLHTGDIGHFDANGFIHIDDRRIDLIVTGGENVYPAEVEAVLTSHPLVAEAAVYAASDPDWGHRVAAAVVLRDGAHVGESDLRSWCGLRLARFKIPKSIRFVDALPRTASGKIKRGLLRNAKYPDR